MHRGCDKNRVDTENMIGLTQKSSFEIIENPYDADIVVINTCGFIDIAREESVNTILEFEPAHKTIVVTGCLSQYYKEELMKEIPCVKAVLGTGDFPRIVQILEEVALGHKCVEISNEPHFIANEETPRFLDKSKPFAYLKISEGCDYACSYCVIPKLRGPQRSRPLKSILQEALFLAQEGVQEILIVAQNTTSYGTDLYGKPSLNELLKELSNASELQNIWIRLHYLYPTGLNEDILNTIKNSKNILPYFDMPLQHSHPEILKLMNRPSVELDIKNLILKIRTLIPEAVIRTTFIVGFPGEKKQHFEHLLSFIKEIKFNHVGVFQYSLEEGTASYNLPHKVPAKIAQARFDEIMSIQQKISLENNSQFIGKIQEVIIEDVQENQSIGRSYLFAPEVDGCFIFEEKLSMRSKVKAFIDNADIYDLYAHTIEGE